MALAMVMFLRGTPTFYYGEEIGMRDAPEPATVEQFKDGLGVWFYHTLRQRGVTHEKALQSAADYFCRDRCRTPMQWRHDANAGFSPANVETWLPVNADYGQGVNVAEQQNAPDSMLSFFRQIAQVRHEHVALRRGEITLLPESGDVLAFWRYTPAQSCLVALNMSAQSTELHLERPVTHCIYTTYPEKQWDSESARLILQPYEIWIGEAVNS